MSFPAVFLCSQNILRNSSFCFRSIPCLPAGYRGIFDYNLKNKEAFYNINTKESLYLFQ